jgi:hypothetical protein
MLNIVQDSTLETESFKQSMVAGSFLGLFYGLASDYLPKKRVLLWVDRSPTPPYSSCRKDADNVRPSVLTWQKRE